MNDLDKKLRRMTIANRLVAVRNQKRMSQESVAVAMGLSQAIISKYEAGLSEVSLDVMIKFADAYGGSIDYILGRELLRDNSTISGRLLTAFEKLPAQNQEVFVLITETVVANIK